MKHTVDIHAVESATSGLAGRVKGRGGRRGLIIKRAVTSRLVQRAVSGLTNLFLDIKAR